MLAVVGGAVLPAASSFIKATAVTTAKAGKAIGWAFFRCIKPERERSTPALILAPLTTKQERVDVLADQLKTQCTLNESPL